MGLKSFKAVMGVLAFLGFVLIINGIGVCVND